MKISVVVVTYNRQKDCNETVQSLLNQTILPDEIIIVDNGPTTPFKLEKKANKVKIKVVRLKESVPLGMARHIGVKLSNGDIICFLDDDAIAAPRWVESFKKAFKKCDIATGPCKPLFLSEIPGWFNRDIHGEFVGFGNYRSYLKNPNEPLYWIRGGNMAVKRKVFDDVGFFKSYLGRYRGKMLAGEESDFVVRAMRKGYTVRFVSGAVMFHKVFPNRLTLKYVFKRSWNGGVSRRIHVLEKIIRPGIVVRSLYYLIDVGVRMLKTLIYIVKQKKSRAVYEVVLMFNRIGFLIGVPL